jgi:hypothetical protein
MKRSQPKPRPRRKPFAPGGRAFKREARHARLRSEGMAIVRSTFKAKNAEIALANLIEEDQWEGY